MMNTSKTCPIDPNLDDEGKKYYSYEKAPIGIHFNVRNDGEHRVSQFKTENLLIYEYGEIKRNYDKSFNSTGVPSAYKYVKSKDFDPRLYSNCRLASEARNRISKFIQHFKKFEYRGVGLYIHSPSTGAGKTLLACIVANGLIREYNEQPRFIKSSVFFEESKRLIRYANKDNLQCEDKLQQIVQSKILIIDDLGAERVTEYINSLMYELISKRTDLHKVTIITSRKGINELKYDTSTISQIARSTRVIELPNEDIGMKTSKEENKELDQLLESK